jgi:hypothetical protein
MGLIGLIADGAPPHSAGAGHAGPGGGCALAALAAGDLFTLCLAWGQWS